MAESLIEWAKKKSAQAWCNPKTKNIIMNADLATAFSEILATECGKRNYRLLCALESKAEDAVLCRDKIIEWAKHHYWDTLEKDKIIILKHIIDNFFPNDSANEMQNEGMREP